MSHVIDEDTLPEVTTEDLVAKYFGPTTPQVQVDFGAMSHPGKVRPNNEDHYSVVRRRRSRDVLFTNLPARLLPQVAEDAYGMAVADGIGGSAFGEIASMLALRTGWDLTTNAFKWHFKASEREAEEVLEMLKLYGQLINRALLERAEADPRLSGMGTTITAAYTIGLDAFIGHVGDSRAYLFRDGSLERLTRDHTLAEEMVEAGVIPNVEAASRYMRNMLVNCLGGRTKEVDVEVNHVQLAHGDRLLLCTDGLTDMVAEAEITRILGRQIRPDDACHELVDLALEHGGKDNVTVVLAAYGLPAENNRPSVSDRSNARPASGS